jgi:hypothetical protein
LFAQFDLIDVKTCCTVRGAIQQDVQELVITSQPGVVS